MNKFITIVLITVLASGIVASCATTKGAIIGGGIGALAGDAGKGAKIGAGVGAIVDILD